MGVKTITKPATDCENPLGEGRPFPEVPRAFNTEQAAIYTGLAVTTLETLRSRGGGPRFVRYSRKAVRYQVRELDAWMATLTVGSTSEVA